MKNPTIADVAERADVSKATVSAVINDKGTVKDSTRRRVLRSIEELNYRPRGSARRRFSAPRSKSIGLIVKEAENPYYAEVIAGVRAFARELGYTILIASSEGHHDAEQRIVELMTSKDVDGLIFTPVTGSDTDLSHVFELKRRNVPFVLLEEVRGVQASLVDVDNVAASQAATDYLIGAGHERIVHFAGPRYSMHRQQRIEGVRRAFSESRLAFSEALIVEAGAHMRSGYEAGQAYFGSFSDAPSAEGAEARDGRAPAERPTAVTCYNDLVAIGLMRALKELGLRVPEDVSVIGFDDLEMLEYLPCSLTSVRMPKNEMGRRAAEMLLRQTEAAGSTEIEKVYLAAELIQRESTRALTVAS